jgi:hypothetical protein
MRLRNQDPTGGHGVNFDPAGKKAPWFFYLEATLDGTKEPWKLAPIGSMYMDITGGAVKWYIKVAANNATADWHRMIGAGDTVTGDLVVTGTITAGDFVASV